MEFWTCYSKSDTLSFILSSFDIDSHNLGPKHISNIVQRTKKEAPHLERFEDTRKLATISVNKKEHQDKEKPICQSC